MLSRRLLLSYIIKFVYLVLTILDYINSENYRLLKTEIKDLILISFNNHYYIKSITLFCGKDINVHELVEFFANLSNKVDAL